MVGTPSSYHNISYWTKIVCVQLELEVYWIQPKSQHIRIYLQLLCIYCVVKTKTANWVLCNPCGITGLNNGRNTFLLSKYNLGNQNSVCAQWIECLQPKSKNNLVYLQLLCIYLGQKQRQIIVYYVTPVVLQS